LLLILSHDRPGLPIITYTVLRDKRPIFRFVLVPKLHILWSLVGHDIHVAHVSHNILDPIVMYGVQLTHLRLVIIQGCIVEPPLVTHPLDILGSDTGYSVVYIGCVILCTLTNSPSSSHGRHIFSQF